MTTTLVGSIVNDPTTVSPTALGDLAVVSVFASPGTPGVVSGGGVAQWVRVDQLFDSPGWAMWELWIGTITAVGAHAISVDGHAQWAQFHSSLGPGTWAVGQTAKASNYAGRSAPITTPAITPAAGGELGIAVGWDESSTTFTFSESQTGWLQHVGAALEVFAYTLDAVVAPQDVSVLSPSDAIGGVILALLAFTPFSAPYTPTLQSPGDSLSQDVSAGQIFEAIYNSSDAQSQSGYALRIKVSGGSYQYWNASTSALQSTIVWNPIVTLPGATFSVSLPAGVIANGNTYNWSFASQEAGASLQSGFATDYTLDTRANPTCTITAPIGTAYSTVPFIDWTQTLGSGASLTGYRIVIESGAYSTTPGSGTTIWDSGVAASTTGMALAIQVPAALTPLDTYRVFLQIVQTGSQPSAWTYSTFAVAAYPPAIPEITAVQGSDPVSGLPSVLLDVQLCDNYLSANDASFELGTSGDWPAPGGSWTSAASLDWAQNGLYSLKITNTSSAALDGSLGLATVLMPVTPGQLIRGMAFFHSPATARQCSVSLVFYSGPTPVSTFESAKVNSTLTGDGAQAFISMATPAGVDGVSIEVKYYAIAAGESVYADAVLLAPGTSTMWTAGGFVGSQTFQIERSDGSFVRNAGWPAGSVLTPPADQLIVVPDLEAVPGEAVSYSAVVTATGLVGQAGTSLPVTLALSSWDVCDPLNTLGGTLIEWSGDSRTFDVVEAQGVFTPLNRETNLVVRGAVLKEAFDLNLQFGGDADAAWQLFKALRAKQVTLLLRGDMPGDLYYVALGSSRPMVLNRTSDRLTNPSRSLTIHCYPVDRP